MVGAEVKVGVGVMFTSPGLVTADKHGELPVLLTIEDMDKAEMLLVAGEMGMIHCGIGGVSGASVCWCVWCW